jgi:hypothetical protein
MPQYCLNDLVFHAESVKIGCQSSAERMPAMPLDASLPQCWFDHLLACLKALFNRAVKISKKGLVAGIRTIFF